MTYLKADYTILIPPDHLLEVAGIEVIDHTAINASTLQPKRTKVGLRKVQEQIFAALLQGYEVASDKTHGGYIAIRLISRDAIKALNEKYQIVEREK